MLSFNFIAQSESFCTRTWSEPVDGDLNLNSIVSGFLPLLSSSTQVVSTYCEDWNPKAFVNFLAISNCALWLSFCIPPYSRILNIELGIP